MEIFPSVFGKVIDVVASAILVFALHIPFLMNVMTSLPTTSVAQPAIEKSSQASTTSTLPAKLSPEAMAEWQKQHDALTNEKCSLVCYPFDAESFYVNDEKMMTKDGYNFISANGTSKVTLKLLRGPQYEARNSSYKVYVGDQLAGGVGGQNFALSSFSPDGKYFAVRSESHLGGGDSFDIFLYVVDLNHKVVRVIRTNHLADETLSKRNPFIDSTFYIESYEWKPDDKINFVGYTVAAFYSERSDYRVTPKMTWTYDIKKNELSLLDGSSTSLNPVFATSSVVVRPGDN